MPNSKVTDEMRDSKTPDDVVSRQGRQGPA